MLLSITLTAAAAAGLLHIWLSLRASAVRMKAQIPMGDGGNPLMLQRMRAHANLVENTPFFLILLGLLELSGAWPLLLWIAALLFVVGRIAHAYGMDRPAPNPLRIAGTMISLTLIGGLAIWAAIVSYNGLNAPPQRQQAPAIRA
jgi:uncharacterized protein